VSSYYSATIPGINNLVKSSLSRDSDDELEAFTGDLDELEVEDDDG
jgi:hypothetical protein